MVSNFLDRVGISTSLLCVLHCLMTPVFVAFVPLLSTAFTHEWFHRTIVLVAVPVAIAAFWNGFRVHRKVAVLALGGFGLIVMVSALWLARDSRTLEMVMMVAAGVSLGIAHYRNLKWSRPRAI